MKFEADKFLCTCDTDRGYVPAGSSSCVLKTDLDQLYLDNFYQSDRDRVIYNDLVNSKGAMEPEYMDGSDIFRQFYVPAAIGCKYKSDPKSCQTLANLCIM